MKIGRLIYPTVIRSSITLLTFVCGTTIVFFVNLRFDRQKTAAYYSITTNLAETPNIQRPQTLISRSPYEKIHAIERPIQCRDRILKPLVRIMLSDEEVRLGVDYLTDESDCSKLWEKFEVDLNKDGSKEILVRGVPCGAVGNCAFWVFQRSRRRIRVLVKAGDYIDLSKMGDQVLKTGTHGYRDILLRGHFSVSETGFYYMKFNGKKYINSRCFYQVPVYTSKKPKWHFVTCAEFYESQGLKP